MPHGERRLSASVPFLVVLLAALAPLLPTATARAQQSVGYADPADTRALLDYRLPDWSYRVWDLNFGLSGQERSDRAPGGPSARSTLNFALGSDYRRDWESERGTAGLQIGGRTALARSNTTTDDSESGGRRFEADVDLSGSLRRHLGDSRAWVQVRAADRHDYVEDKTWSHPDDDDSLVNVAYTRRRAASAGLDVGWGRLRNVTPVVRAARFSERLVALGRAPLQPGQIHRLARVFATREGYDAVHDRPERWFWSDAFAAVTGDDTPLTPVEVLYLQDVLDEVLGTRRQGWELGAGFSFSEDERDGASGTTYSRARTLSAGGAWAHNPSLTRQWELSADVRYSWYGNLVDSGVGGAAFAATHVWDLADRYRWTATASYAHETIVYGSGRRGRTADLVSDLDVYLEDELALRARIAGNYDWFRFDQDVQFRWDVIYSLSLVWHLDRALL